MDFFYLNSPYIQNAFKGLKLLDNYKTPEFSIIINHNHKIKIPLPLAIIISSKVLDLLQVDKTAEELNVELISKTSIDDAVNKIQSVIVNNKRIKLEDENEMRIFAEFGIEIGNEDFMEPFINYIGNSDEPLSVSNVTRLLTYKIVFNIPNMKKEIKFIAKKFEAMRNNDEFFKFASNVNNVSIVEKIITCDKIKMYSEDSLLDFLISITKENNLNDSYLHLFKFCYIQKCSKNKKSNFLDLVKEAVNPNNKDLLFLYLNQILLNGETQEINIETKKRYFKPWKTFEPSGSIGIIKYESSEDEIILEASSSHSSDVNSILTDDQNDDFWTENKENQYIQATLTNEKKSFIIKSYKIAVPNYSRKSGLLQTWELHGQKAADDQWIIIDSQFEKSFGKNKMKEFEVNCVDKLKAVKLIQTGRNTNNKEEEYFLKISSFDVFGDIYMDE